MSRLADKPDISVTPPKKVRSRRLGITGRILILSLLALNIGVLHEYVGWDKRVLGWLLYRIDPRYWPVWISGLLWGIVAWQCNNFLVNNALKFRVAWIAGRQLRIKTGIVLAMLCYAAWLAGWTEPGFLRRVYYLVYVDYVMGPISIYLVDDTWSWKLLITPTLGLVVIAPLLYVAYSQRKKRHESTIEYENSGERAE